jgi:hypothetical protein
MRYTASPINSEVMVCMPAFSLSALSAKTAAPDTSPEAQAWGKPSSAMTVIIQSAKTGHPL